jgi:transcription elongation factor GreA
LYFCSPNLIQVYWIEIFVILGTTKTNLFKTKKGSHSIYKALKMSNISYYSAEGLQKLKDELHFLEHQERPRISEAIAEARDKGDLSENAEYHAAKEQQSIIEYKIVQLKNTLANARIIDESQLDNSKALIRSKVKIKNLTLNKEMSFLLVADAEADLAGGKLSVNSPIGKGILGKKLGDIIDIAVPNGKFQVEILEISR